MLSGRAEGVSTPGSIKATKRRCDIAAFSPTLVVHVESPTSGRQSPPAGTVAAVDISLNSLCLALASRFPGSQGLRTRELAALVYLSQRDGIGLQAGTFCYTLQPPSWDGPRSQDLDRRLAAMAAADQLIETGGRLHARLGAHADLSATERDRAAEAFDRWHLHRADWESIGAARLLAAGGRSEQRARATLEGTRRDFSNRHWAEIWSLANRLPRGRVLASMPVRSLGLEDALFGRRSQALTV